MATVLDREELVARLARLAGLVPSYRDQRGTLRVASAEGQRRCLEAMGFDLSTPVALDEAIKSLRHPSPHALHVTQEGNNPRLSGSHFSYWSKLPATIAIRLEDGTHLTAHLTSTGEILPEHPLPIGYHEMTAPGWRHPLHLAVTPTLSYHPQWVLRQESRWGLATHLYALGGAGPLGLFSDLATLLEGVAAAGGDGVLINPICAGFLDRPEVKSPYQPSDRRGLNPLYIDVHAAAREFGVEIEWDEAPAGIDIDYPRAAASQLAGLRALVATAPRLVEQAADFGGDDFAAWQAGRMAGTDPAFIRFLQWLADHQLGQAAEVARKGGMATGVIRDLPVGPAHGGFEAGSRIEGVPLFASGADIGAPPDDYSETGQNWGIAPLNPIALRRFGFRPFLELLRANMRHAGGLRIDHAMWLERVFWIPPGCDGTQGVYVRYPVDEMFGLAALESQRARCLLIGEDLGTVPADFRARMLHAGMLSTKLAYFERDAAGGLADPEGYPYMSCIQVTNHDLPPLRAWWSQTAREEREAFAKAVAGVTPSVRGRNGYANTQRRLSTLLDEAGSALALARLEDVAQMDRGLNVPGTDTPGNWAVRMRMTPAEVMAGGAWRDMVGRMGGRGKKD